MDLLWTLLVPLCGLLFVLLGRPKGGFGLVLTLAITSIAIGWVVFYAWMYLSFDAPHEGRAFDRVEFRVHETETARSHCSFF